MSRVKNHHLVYKITNNQTGEYYIGVHTTHNPKDRYMGSGHRIRSAIAKYGAANFSKEILFDFKTRAEALAKEAELVNEQTLLDRLCYNLMVGGVGASIIQAGKRTPRERKPQQERWEPFDKDYFYAFYPAHLQLESWRKNAELCHTAAVYRGEPKDLCDFRIKATRIMIEGFADFCKSLTKFYNNKYTHKKAKEIIQLYEKNGLASCIKGIGRRWNSCEIAVIQ